VKTTNAKAKAFQTPAVPLGIAKPIKTDNKSSTLRKSREVRAVASPDQSDQPGNGPEVEDRDIEYMPPKPQGMDRFSLEQNLHLTLTSDSSP
jgi:hypothetical protein